MLQIVSPSFDPILRLRREVLPLVNDPLLDDIELFICFLDDNNVLVVSVVHFFSYIKLYIYIKKINI